ncbi:MAG TPA: hypothetical protein VIE43_22860 [Thermoanaerobaculia bacterium]|jgi:hypothetical protein|nr:hypothetical protein [Thermoanaerobaculia bacterium]
MKTLLRTLAVTAALALSAFAMTGHAAVNVNGTCEVVCFNSTTHMGSVVTVSSTETQCCSSTFDPCPAGSSPLTRNFTYLGGLRHCL